MNEALLQRLEREAEKITLDMPASLSDSEFTAIFNAELVQLVLRECFDILASYRGKVIWLNEDTNHNHPIQEIAKHFGVES
jgi:hypothetical protein